MNIFRWKNPSYPLAGLSARILKIYFFKSNNYRIWFHIPNKYLPALVKTENSNGKKFILKNKTYWKSLEMLLLVVMLENT